MKKFYALFLSLAIFASFVGCSANKTASSSASVSSQSSAPASSNSISSSQNSQPVYQQEDELIFSNGTNPQFVRQGDTIGEWTIEKLEVRRKSDVFSSVSSGQDQIVLSSGSLTGAVELTGDITFNTEDPLVEYSIHFNPNAESLAKLPISSFLYNGMVQSGKPVQDYITVTYSPELAKNISQGAVKGTYENATIVASEFSFFVVDGAEFGIQVTTEEITNQGTFIPV